MVQQPFRPFRPAAATSSQRQTNFGQQKPSPKGVNDGFNFQTLPNPTNLSNSAVLRLLAEDEPRLRRVIWPPPSPPLVDSENPEDPTSPLSSPRHLLSKPNTPTRQLFSPPPTTITLRPELPTSQAPPPVFVSQPATATMQGGKHLRGDMKWPPEQYKQQAEVENEARIALAKGPVFRPRKVQKDYSSFFAQHSLTNNYPGYRVPPGTQHYIEEGTSNL
uniref:Uncharacterized protein n=1 Tax=Cacopsylla melanoneura TaxID=428564 RepID=A0A8D8TIG2_9HEMI